jgi:hypothetical protein
MIDEELVQIPIWPLMCQELLSLFAVLWVGAAVSVEIAKTLKLIQKGILITVISQTTYRTIASR